VNKTNEVWKRKVSQCLSDYDVVSIPRGFEVREVINGHYTVPMPAFLDLTDRNVLVPFMFAEAAWIVGGSNRLSDLTPFMKSYANFSDDKKFLRGAYGPKVVDQLPYVVDSIMNDYDTRQAVLTIWRERPGPSKDVPCTVAMQFIVRDKVLHSVVTMRSNDIILGFTYDVFTFSMVAFAVKLLLKERGFDVELGNLHVNAGSLHIYDRHYDDAGTWMFSKERDLSIKKRVMEVMKAENYEDLIATLKEEAIAAKNK
jgi:thymidylate synthase